MRGTGAVITPKSDVKKVLRSEEIGKYDNVLLINEKNKNKKKSVDDNINKQQPQQQQQQQEARKMINDRKRNHMKSKLRPTSASQLPSFSSIKTLSDLQIFVKKKTSTRAFSSFLTLYLSKWVNKLDFQNNKHILWGSRMFFILYVVINTVVMNSQRDQLRAHVEALQDRYESSIDIEE